MEKIQDLKLEALPLAPYSPNLAPCDFNFFRPLKDAIHGCHFPSGKEVKKAMYEWLAQ